MATLPIDQVRAELAARVIALGQQRRLARAGELARQIDEIRATAFANGLFPAVTVAHALEAALSRGEAGALIDGWLAILRDALGTDRTDAGACAAYAGACSVRFYN